MERHKNYIVFICLLLSYVYRTTLGSSISDLSEEKNDMLKVADGFMEGWTSYAIEDNLDPLLSSRLFVDSTNGSVYIDKSSFCKLQNGYSHLPVYSFLSVNANHEIGLIRMVSLYKDQGVICNHSLNKIPKNHNSDNTVTLIVPNEMLTNSIPVDFRPLFSVKTEYPLEVGFKFHLCTGRNDSDAGPILHVQKSLQEIAHKCSSRNEKFLNLIAAVKGEIIEELGVKVLLQKDYEKSLKLRKRSKRSLDPLFPRRQYVIPVKENEKVGFKITTIQVEPSSVPGTTITYSISPSNIGFQINAQTGDITLTSKLDFEIKQLYTLWVRTATDATRLQIKVIDVNDNDPVFERNPYTISIYENIKSTESILDVKATDKDSTSNGEIRYSIVNPGGVNKAFDIDEYSGQIFLPNTRLDREKTDKYELIVKAEDLGETKRSSTTKVIITILDVNDNSPVFEKPEYTKSISEKTGVGERVLTVKALDKDEGTNSKLSYVIFNDYSNPVVSKFDMNRLTGEITLKQKLDYENERERSIRFTVDATDAGIPPKKGSAFVSISVTDDNDNAPIFRSGCVEYVFENAAIGDTVCTVSASDRDSSAPNNEVLYTLDNAPKNLPFIVDYDTGQVKVSAALDYDNPDTRKFEFAIKASDKGNPIKSSTTNARITLKNVNDNYPKFSKPNYKVSIPETTRPGDSILQLSATDVDQPGSTEFQYSIIKGNEKNCFSITDNKIYVQCNLNYDIDKLFNLTVEVKDSGALGKQFSTQTYALVQISDANTHAPLFRKTSLIPSISEDAPIGTLVFNVSATDLDSGINGKISYSLINSDGYFKIDAVTGEVRTVKELNSETLQKHELRVMARDHGIPMKSSIHMWTITVTDINDNAPIFQKLVYRESVMEDVVVGSFLLRVRAFDVDSDFNNRQIVYSMSPEHNGNGTFYIKTEGRYGTVRNSKKLDREKIDKYELVVYATDKGSPPRNSSAKIMLTVNDVMDSPPVFDKSLYNVTLKENFQSGEKIIDVRATTADFHKNSEISYLINRGLEGSMFTIDGFTGEISLRQGRSLDYETKKEYRFGVTAYYGTTGFEATTTVVVKLEDLNDNVPTLEPFNIFINYFQDKFPKGAAVKIPAYDKDVNDVLSYEIRGGDGRKYVKLDPKTGNLTFMSNIENVGSEVRIDVRVSDGTFDNDGEGSITPTLVTNETINNLVRIVLNDMTVTSFLSSANIKLFRKAFADAVGCNKRLVFIVGVQVYTSHLATDNKPKVKISVTARKERTGGPFFTPKHMKDSLYLNKVRFTKTMGKEVVSFDDGDELWCGIESCDNYKNCRMKVTYIDKPGYAARPIVTATTVFWGIEAKTTPSCVCPRGYRDRVVGRMISKCAVPFNLCYSNPCKSNGRCVSTGTGYACICKRGYAGKNCDIDMNQSTCPSNPAGVCLNSGVCAPDLVNDGLKCVCTASSSDHTSRCQLTTRSFSAGSYLSFTGLTKSRWKLLISLEFATSLANAVLLYNGRYSEKRDFLAIRIKEGQVELVFSLYENPVVVRSYVDGGVSDGSWKKVTIAFENKNKGYWRKEAPFEGVVLERGYPVGRRDIRERRPRRKDGYQGEEATLEGVIGRIAVGKDCDIEMATLANADTKRKYCAGSKTFLSKGFNSLDLSAPFHIGGHPNLGFSMRIPNWDFIGCIRNVYIDHMLLDLQKPLQQNLTSPGCPDSKKDFCVGSPCVHGTCVTTLGGFKCDCKDGYVGKLCNIDLKSKSPVVRFETGASVLFTNLVYTLKAPVTSVAAEMSVRTRQTESVLIHQEIDGKSAYLKIVSGSLKYFCDAKEMANLSSAFLSDGQWHHVKVRLDSKSIQLSQDYERHHVTRSHHLKIDSKPIKFLSVGGVRQSQTVTQGFLGCLQGFLTNGIYQTIQGQNIRPGCQSKSQCGSCGTGKCSGGWDKEVCECAKGYTGPNCEDVCQLKPCLNEGVCKRSSTAIHGFICDCKASFTGVRCETKMSTVCEDGYYGLPGKGLCGPCNCDVRRSFHPKCDKTSGKCFCKDGYYLSGDDCNSCNCLKEGTINNECNRLTGQCRCKPGVVGLQCDRCMGPFEAIKNNCHEINTSCPEAYAENMWWSRVDLGKTKMEKCPSGTTGNATRYCHPKKGWQKPDLGLCTTNEFNLARKMVKKLDKKEIKMTKTLAKELATSLEYALTTGKPLFENDIRISYTALSKIIEFEANQTQYNLISATDGKFVQNVVTSTSRILQKDAQLYWNKIQKADGGTVTLMGKVEKLLAILTDNFSYVKRRQKRSVTTLPPYGFASKNILMEFQQLNIKDASSYRFPLQQTPWTKGISSWATIQSRIKIPTGAFNGTDVSNEEAAVGLVLYRTLGDLLPTLYQDHSSKKSYNVQVYSDVLTLTVPGLNNRTLNDNITIIFLNKKNNMSSSGLDCVSWNYSSPSSKWGGWTKAGCVLVPGNGSTITCQCNHMTSFAAVKFIEIIPPKAGAFKIQYLTYVTVAVSIVLLFLTLLTYICLSQLRSNSNSISKNLCAALLFAELVFIAGINRTADPTVCRIIAILLHYFFSCVFSWMLVEAVHLYRMLVEKRNVNYEHMTFYYFIGWGAPVIVVGVTAGLSPEGYGNSRFCWISTQGQLLWTFTAPILCMVAVNLLVFVLATCASCRRQVSVKEAKNRARLRFNLLVSAVLLPVLCATFVIGLLAVNSDLNKFSILFSGFIIVPGLYIILFHVLFNKEVRNELKNAYIRWKTGDPSYGKKKPRVKRTLLVDSSYRSQLAHLTTTFNLSTTTTDSSTDGGRAFAKRRREDRSDLPSSTQPDSSDTSDEDTGPNPDTNLSDSSDSSDDDDLRLPSPPTMAGKGHKSAMSPNSSRSSNSAKQPNGSRSPTGGKSSSSGGATSPPMSAARTPDWKVANQKKLRTAPLYASDGPMHSTPSDNSDNSEKRGKRFSPLEDEKNPVLDLTDVTVLNEDDKDGPEDPLLLSLRRQRPDHGSSSDSSEVSSLPSVISRVGPGGKPQSILKKKSKYGSATDSDSDRRGKVRQSVGGVAVSMVAFQAIDPGFKILKCDRKISFIENENSPESS
eukprot:gene6157-6864_t